MHTAAHGLISPPTTPPPQVQAPRCPPTAESRLGVYLGPALQLRTILGTGAYGVVYGAFDHSTHLSYAVKALPKTNSNGEPLDRRQQEFQSREIRLHYAASAHPNIVSMLKIVDDPDCTYVVLEYCPEGDLFSNITERGRYVGNDAAVRQAFLQVLNAVEHCHRLGIYHRDLKPENILVSQSGNQVLLADFGLATTDIESDDHGCGSTFYMSPECLDQSSRNVSYRCAPNDIWSLGVILVNLACGRNPWKQASTEDSTYKAFTRNRDFLKTILPLSDELNEILGMIFERNPEDRITVSELKQRILECSAFSAPPQQLLPTPPCSPKSAAVDEYETLSDDGSIMSDEGSLTGSCSTLSDSDSDSSDSGSDSGYESREGSPERDQDLDTCNHNHIAPVAQRPANPVPSPAAYVLPPPETQWNPFGQTAKPVPWMQPAQHWGYPYGQYVEQFHAAHVHPAPAVYTHHRPAYSSHHHQFVRQQAAW